MKNINFEVRYYVNKEKKTIAAVIPEGYRYLRMFAPPNWKHEFSVFIDPSYRKFHRKSQYIGIAKCSPDDEWDEEIGKEIAKNRAVASLLTDVMNVLRVVYKKTLIFYNDVGEAFCSANLMREKAKDKVRK